MFQGFCYKNVPSNKLSYFSTKTYVVGTHKNRTSVTFFLAPNYRLNRLSKKTFTIYAQKLCLSRVCCILYADMIHLSEGPTDCT